MESLLTKNKSKPILVAISGVKNSGKTTLIEKLIPKINEYGYKVATIKHDGHDFNCDIENTDTYKHKKAGAYGTAIFSKNKFMVVKEQKDTKEEELISLFPEADIILLEGFKFSNYPKIELVRRGNSEESVSKKETLIALATDFNLEYEGVKVVDLNDIDEITEVLITYIRRCQVD